MKKLLPFSVALSFLLLSCAGGAFRAFEGSVADDELCKLTLDAVENGSVSFASINGVAPNASEVLFKGRSDNQVALTYKNKNGTLTQTLSFTAPAGKECKAAATTEERNFKMGSAELRTYATLWIECGGELLAGTDNSDDMEAVQ